MVLSFKTTNIWKYKMTEKNKERHVELSENVHPCFDEYVCFLIYYFILN